MKTRKYIPSFITSLYHFSLSFLGALFYSFPSRKIKVIGVTGTSGKSTTVKMIEKILEEAGGKVASISSISFKIGEKEWENKLKMTMPGRMKIQKFLRKAVEEKCDHLVLEVTSEGIEQFRHKFIDFDVCCFLNLKPEHIESHGSFENYKRAKLKLFKELENSKKKNKVIVVNLDDENAKDFLNFKVEKKIGFTTSNQSYPLKEIVRAENIKIKNLEVDFSVRGVNFHLNLPGIFNVYNALCAISVGVSQGISLNQMKKALEKIEKVEGRMEMVIKKPFRVIVDYAHTPFALKNVYGILKENYPYSRLICVLGAAGGGRDKWKRPVLGKIAKDFCQEIIITNEDPYEEDPLEIIKQVASGAGEKAQKILDRREAIKKALSLAREEDVVIITGKGSEPWMCVKGGKKIPWSDKKIVLEEFEKLYGSKN